MANMVKKLLNWPEELEQKFKLLALKKKMSVNAMVVDILDTYMTRLEKSKQVPEEFVEPEPDVPRSKVASDSF